jgi:hypothetical protein
VGRAARGNWLGGRNDAGHSFSRELGSNVLAGDITLSVRPWKRPRVKQDGHHRVGLDEIEIDPIELLALAAITGEDESA